MSSHLNFPTLRFLSVSSLLFLLLLSSCADNKVPATDNNIGNSIIFGGTTSNIESVIWSLDEDGQYTFWFSPTAGLVSLDAMLLADDWIRITTDSPGGEINLLSAGNSLMYGDLRVSSQNSDKVSSSFLSLNLTSKSTVSMELDLAMKDGQTLVASYDGLCTDVSGAGDGSVIQLDHQVFFYYYGQAENGAGTNNYYLAVSDIDQWSGSGLQSAPQSAGYVLTLDFYGTAGDRWQDFPSGEFTESDSREAQTYYSASTYSFVTYYDGEGSSVELRLSGTPITIEYVGAGIYTVTADFIDVDDSDKTLVYTGTLDVANATVQTYLPLIGDDVDFDGVPSADDPGGLADAIYYGDVYESGTGLMSIYIYDKNGSNYREGGYGMSIMIFTRTFNEDPYIEEGRYTIASTFDRWTALPGAEGTLLGGVVPWGTYVATVDDAQSESGAYSFASSGEIIISRVGDRGYYRIEFDLESMDGYTIKGAFEGDIPIQDASDDDDGNDGSTNLETDIDLDLSYMPYATCTPKNTIYVAGLGTIPVEDITTAYPPGEACGYQTIDIGPATGYYEPDERYPETGKLHPGDAIRLDLLVDPGTENMITPGKYNITPNRYPAQMKPGVCVRGYPGVAGNDGTRYVQVVEAIGNGYPKGLAEEYRTEDAFMINGPINIADMGDFACLYSGSVTISIADAMEDGTPQFTFSIDGFDVLNHEISGTWTGPVYISGTPAQPNDGSTSSLSARQSEKKAARRIYDRGQVGHTKDYQYFTNTIKTF